jgi:hypothetical protein
MTMPQFKDLFVSYGRRESLGFVGRLFILGYTNEYVIGVVMRVVLV